MENAHSVIRNKLQAFIQKYYQNILIKGLILTFSVSTIGFISFAVLEYFGHFGVYTRTFFFWSFVVFSTLFFLIWVVRPLFKLAKFGKQITDKQAAQIIGRHFPSVNDKLLNVIQLKNEANSDRGLIEASITQKSKELYKVPFVGAVNFNDNRKFVKYALLPLFVFVGLYASDYEGLITEGSTRIIDYNTEYIPPPPFRFNVLNSNLECVQHQDFTVSIQLSGDEIPTEVFLELEGLSIKMKSLAQHVFEFEFKNIQQSQVFKFSAGGINSTSNLLKVLEAPSMIEFKLTLDFPNYLSRPNQVLVNQGEIVAPEGTLLDWSFYTDNTDTLKVFWGRQLHIATQTAINHYSFEQTAKESLDYTFLASSKEVPPQDSLKYTIKVLKDAYPIIFVEELIDSIQLKMKYFKGEIRDDYGFEKMLFVVENEYTGWDSIVPIKISLQANKDNFFFLFDIREKQMRDEEVLKYHFEVYDNDGVNGSKKSNSKSFEFKPPSKKDLEHFQGEKTKELKHLLEESVTLAKDLQEDFEQLKMKLLSKEELSWGDKQRVKAASEKQKLLETKIDQLAKKNKQKIAMKEQFSEQDQRVLDKQNQLQELLEELMTEEMRNLFDEMEEMMEKMKTDEWMQKLEEMQMSNNNLEKELDRNLEMLKKLQFEEALEETEEDLKLLIQKQEELKETNDKGTSNQEEITRLQKEIKNEFDNVSDKIDDLQKMNEALEKQKKLPETKEIQDSVEEKINESVENSEKKKRKKTSEAQKHTISQMQKLQEKIKQAKPSSSESSPPEDMNALRQVLENLIDLSLEEEQLLTNLSKINKSDPQYVELIFWQNKLKDDSKILEDSLYALSKRQIQIKATINREMTAINNNLNKSLNYMAERETSQALNQQQLVMTSANNLALMLSDVLQSMQEDQANKTPGDQQCNKPGSGNPSPGDLKKMQEHLKNQMEQMKNGEGIKPQSKKNHGKDLAKMMRRQEMIRQQLEKMAHKLSESENGQAERLQNTIQKMEQTEQEISNDNITRETFIRQNQIIDHLIQAEKAEQERGKEKERESKEGSPLPHDVEDALKDYQEKKLKQAELLRTIPPQLKPFYKSRVNEYFLNIE